MIVTHSYPDCTSESGSRRALLTTSGCPPHTASRRQASLRASQRHGPWPLHGDAHSPAPGQSILFMFRLRSVHNGIGWIYYPDIKNRSSSSAPQNPGRKRPEVLRDSAVLHKTMMRRYPTTCRSAVYMKARKPQAAAGLQEGQPMQKFAALQQK